MQLDLFSLAVYVGGRPVREYGYDGRTYVPGKSLKDYSVRVVSRSPRRVKAVVSVDGLNVIDGKPAGLGGSGYILNPYSALDIPGWRLTDDEVAMFRFGATEASYAASKGKAENVGVIGAAFFDEVPPKPPAVVGLAAVRPRGPAVSKGGHAPSPTAPGTYGGSLGTGFGPKTDHVVKRAEFDARPTPSAVIELRYEDAAILRAMGVDVADDAAAVHTPSAFPADGYCAPPRGWRG